MRRPTKTSVVTDFRRAQILDAARASFARHGFAGTTVDEIAHVAKLAKGTVYLYYRSKDDIVRDALDSGLAALREATVPAITASGTFGERLLRFLSGMLQHFDRHRDFMELCQLELGAEMRRRARQAFGAIYAAQVDAWELALDEGVKHGELAPVDPHHTALVIVGLAHGLAMQRVRGWTNTPVAADVEQTSTIIRKGLEQR